ncbi:MAG: ABC transporter permease [Sporocytophaga sp.]|uniref:ABC transporter permease n=1 Tax=Sporocytophaga sp. TaxID=2231183 RepID=UPI001B2D2021|nr:ABC transporter permease [Sporocytophaga sp.]MBO9701638.1 ABC transporter permease [Sporocytophaga sp.]
MSEIENLERIEYEIKPAGNLSLNLSELWQYKELFYFFTWRDIKVKYKQTYLGVAWVVLQPFITMVVFSVFFGKLLKVPSMGLPYPVFVFSGLMFWNIFSSGLTNSGDSMVSNANIIKKIYFPRLIIPVSALLVSVFDFVFTFILFIGLALIVGFSIPLRFFVFLPLGLSLTILTTFGLGTLLSALNVKYRDFRYTIPFIIQLTLFLTPVIYPVSIIKSNWAKYFFALNPMTGAINLSRAGLTSTSVDIIPLLISGGSALIIAVLGILIFKKTEAYFADLA